jgi:hypothetical protein
MKMGAKRKATALFIVRFLGKKLVGLGLTLLCVLKTG